MKIEKISSQSTFNARVSQKFVKNAETFYLNRNLPIQYDLFKKKLAQIEYYGSQDSVIMHTQIKNKTESIPLLYLKNPQLNNNQGVVLKKANKYNEILRYFTTLHSEVIEEAEKILAKT